jgi:hypothetical protein
MTTTHELARALLAMPDVPVAPAIRLMLTKGTCGDRLSILPQDVAGEAGSAVRINPTHEAADAFWKRWSEVGETHKRGYYESTWSAINAALAASGLAASSGVSESAGQVLGAAAQDASDASEQDDPNPSGEARKP